jgi:hypothetical protein
MSEFNEFRRYVAAVATLVALGGLASGCGGETARDAQKDQPQAARFQPPKPAFPPRINLIESVYSDGVRTDTFMPTRSNMIDASARFFCDENTLIEQRTMTIRTGISPKGEMAHYTFIGVDSKRNDTVCADGSVDAEDFEIGVKPLVPTVPRESLPIFHA